MKNWIALSYICVGLGLALPAAAQDASQSGNLPADFYPRTCVRPDPSKVNRMAHTEALLFNRQVGEYKACAKTYLANAKHDAEHVLAMMNAQVAIANGEAVRPIKLGPSNMPADFYPRSSCVKPDRAAIGEAPGAQDAMAAYNQRVKEYNIQLTAFNACTKDYIEKGRIDIAHIQAVIEATQ